MGMTMEPMGKGYLLGEPNDLGQSRCWPRVKNQQGSPQPPPTASTGTHLLSAGLGRMGVTLHPQGTSTVKASSEGQVPPGSIYPELKSGPTEAIGGLRLEPHALKV